MSKEVTIQNHCRSRKFGWGYTFQPTGEGTSIETPTAPDYTGTLNQIQKAKEDDATWNNTTAFSNTAWFYDGQRILATWQFTCLKRADGLEFDPENDDHSNYLKRNSIHHSENDVYGWGWVKGWAGAEENSVKIRVE